MKAEIAKVTDHIDANFDAPAMQQAAQERKIDKIYKQVRPVLSALNLFPFIPKKWKAVLKEFVAAMDLITGTIPS